LLGYLDADAGLGLSLRLDTSIDPHFLQGSSDGYRVGGGSLFPCATATRGAWCAFGIDTFSSAANAVSKRSCQSRGYFERMSLHTRMLASFLMQSEDTLQETQTSSHPLHHLQYAQDGTQSIKRYYEYSFALPEKFNVPCVRDKTGTLRHVDGLGAFGFSPPGSEWREKKRSWAKP
jgi:hypothetical protein